MWFLKRVKATSLVLGAMALAGCSMTYNIGGQFEDTGQPFFGKVTVTLGDSGTLDVATADGKVTCSGTSEVTKKPSGMTTVGARGRATAKCSDGRSFKVDFIQTTESGGHGKGIDSNGNIVQVFFDETEEVVQSNVQMQRLNAIIK